MNKKQHNSTSLQSFLDSVIEESVKSALQKRAMQEKSLQDTTTSQVGSLSEDDVTNDESQKESSGSSGGEQAAPSKTIDDEKQKMKSGNVNTDDIIGKLNYMRSGKSFNDEQIHRKMDEYIKSLSKEERIALFAFLKGISQIVTGEIAPDDAAEPDDNPANIEMKKSNEKQVKSIQPNVIKKAGGDSTKSKTNAEDDSSPTPIKPKSSPTK
jgi:hypothetical protein